MYDDIDMDDMDDFDDEYYRDSLGLQDRDFMDDRDDTEDGRFEEYDSGRDDGRGSSGINEDSRSDAEEDYVEEQIQSRAEQKAAERQAKAERAAMYPDDRSRTAGEMNYGGIGKLTGLIIGIVSFVTEVIGVAVRNLFLSARERMDLSEAFKKSFARAQNEQDKKNSGKNKDGQNKDDKGKNGEKGPEKDGEKKDINEKKGTDPEKDGRVTEEAQHGGSEDLTEENTDTHGEAVGKEDEGKMRDAEAAVILNDGTVKNIFSDMGLKAFLKEGSGEIYLYRADDPKWAEHVTSMSRDGMIEGNYDTLAEAVAESWKLDGKGGRNAGTYAAIDALMAGSLISCRAYPDQMEATREAGKTYILGSVHAGTENGSSLMEIASSRKDGCVDILYNGKQICRPVSTQDFLSDPGTQTRIREALSHAVKDEREQSYSIGDDDKIVFRRTDRGKVNVSFKDVTGWQKIGNYRLEEEKDIRALEADLKLKIGDSLPVRSGGTEREVVSKALAYTIAAVSNPDIKESVSKKGRYYDPFSDTYRNAGAAHISVEREGSGVAFKEHVPDEAGHMQSETFYSYSNGRTDHKGGQVNDLACLMQDKMETVSAAKTEDREYSRGSESAKGSPFKDPADAKEVIGIQSRNVDMDAIIFDVQKSLDEMQEKSHIAGEEKEFYESLASGADEYDRMMEEQRKAEDAILYSDLDPEPMDGQTPSYDEEEPSL